MTAFYAHSVKDKSKPKSTWQSLQSHLTAVSEMASERAKIASPGNSALSEAALAAGLLHDLGKYRAEFQLYIQNLPVQKEKTYHKQAVRPRPIEPDMPRWPLPSRVIMAACPILLT